MRIDIHSFYASMVAHLSGLDKIPSNEPLIPFCDPNERGKKIDSLTSDQLHQLTTETLDKLKEENKNE